MDRNSEVKADPRRALPSVDRLARRLREREPGVPLWCANHASRRALAELREGLHPGEPGDAGRTEVELEDRAVQLARELARPHPARVVNATGVVLHTNLGRAVLAAGAARAVAEAAASYADLELDLATGERGDRLAGVGELLALASGAEAAMAVNNNAAAVLLIANTLARGGEVVISRGELVEIGGSFRVPEVMERAGVRLVEVGTTNRTRIADYAQALGPDTRLLLKVHRSNFEQRGFVEDASLEELVALGRERGVPVAEDLGSGTLIDLRSQGLPADSHAPARLALGADLVCFSGDKLVGGPQSGLILGRRASIAALRSNPLARALRLDKLSLAALDWTLRRVLDGSALQELPTLRQLAEPLDRVEERARALASRLTKLAGDAPASDAPDPGSLDSRPRSVDERDPGLSVRVERGRAPVGGGSLPGYTLDTWRVALSAPGGAQRLVERLRAAPVPVLARVRDGRVLLDARTLLPGDEADIEAALAAEGPQRRAGS